MKALNYNIIINSLQKLSILGWGKWRWVVRWHRLHWCSGDGDVSEDDDEYGDYDDDGDDDDGDDDDDDDGDDAKRGGKNVFDEDKSVVCWHNWHLGHILLINLPLQNMLWKNLNMSL